jgi:hypothetical protein
VSARRPRACLAAGLAALALALPAPCSAQEGAAGQAALDRARAAWDKGDFDVSEPLYSEAITAGGLAPDDFLEAQVHLGSARAVQGKKAAALAAFKDAAVLDPRFSVPTEAGKRAMALADQARRLVAGAAPLMLHAEIPEHLDPGAPASVEVTLDADHAVAVPGSRIGVYAHDPLGGRSHVESVPAARTARFELPGRLFLPSATVHVRVDWLDRHANRLATTEEQIHVYPLPMADMPAGLAGSRAHGPAHGDGKHGGFWHTAWPYILGGAALAAGGAAVYFATRSSDDVDVTGVRVLTH